MPSKRSLADITGLTKEAGEEILVESVTMLTRAEIAFPNSGEKFGLYSTPALAGHPDNFFGIDTALSMLVSSIETRQAAVNILSRVGIDSARERYQLAMVNPAPDQWNWDKEGRHHDAMRQMYAASPVKILDMLWGASKQYNVDPGSGFADNYPDYAQAWTQIIARYSADWIGWEIGNEPDQGAFPSDQYVGIVKAASYAANQKKLTVPVVSGAFASSPPGSFFDTCAANGMLDDSDAVSFHFYDDAMAMQGLIERYRQWLGNSGHQPMPLWITECGKPWPAGRSRPLAADDMASAGQITMKGIEAKACGAATYFPFVLVAYRETDSAFGLLDENATPLRQFAAYAYSSLALRGANYVGDLKIDDPSVRRARVFATPDDRRVVVIYRSPSNGPSIHLALPVTQITGADGRSLAPLANGDIPTPDDLTYLWIDKAAVEPQLMHDTRAAALLAIPQTWKPRPRLASPIVLRFDYANSTVQHSQRRYMVQPTDLAKFSLSAVVSNLSNEKHSVKLSLIAPGTKTTDAEFSQPTTIDVPPMTTKPVQWSMNLTPYVDVAQTRFLVVNSTCDDTGVVAPLAIPLITEGDLPAHLARHSITIPMPVTDLSKWSENQAGGTAAKFSSVDNGFQMDITVNPGSRGWAFPTFAVPVGLDLSQCTGIVIRAKITNWSRHVGVLLDLDGPHKGGFELLDLFPPDNAWHVLYVPFDELRPSGNNPDAQNARFDSTYLKTISVGMVSAKSTNSLQISDIILVGGSR